MAMYKFVFNPFTSNFDEVIDTPIPSGDISGPPNTFAGFDSTGALGSVPGWNFTNTATDYGAFVQPGLPSTLTTIEGIRFVLLLDGQTVGGLTTYNNENVLGATTATVLGSYQGYSQSTGFDANVTLNGLVEGFVDSNNSQPGAVIPDYASINLRPNFNHVTMNTYAGVRIQPAFGNTDPMHLNSINDIVASYAVGANADVDQHIALDVNNTYPTGSTLDGYWSLNLHPNFDVIGMNGYRGIQIGANFGQNSVTDVNNIIELQTSLNAFSNATVGSYSGISIGPNFQVGSTVTNGANVISANINVLGSFDNFLSMYAAFGNFAPTNAYTGSVSAYVANLGIDGPLGNGQAFNDNTQFGPNASITTGEWTSLNVGPNFQAGSVVRSYTAVNANPQFNSPITDDIRGFGVFFNSPTAGTNITGMEVNINNAVATTGGITGLNININNSTDSNPQGVVGISSNSRLQVNATTQLKAAQGFQIGSRLEHAFSVPLGSPVTGTDELGINIAGDFIVQDDVANGGFGIGFNSVGFIASMGVAATKTVDSITVFLPAASLPDPGFTTGGTATEFHHIRVFPPLPQGGTLNITNLYALKIDSLFGDYAAAATNAWGLYLDTSATNYMGTGLLQLGGATSGLLSLKAAAVTTSHTLTMPAAQGAASTVLTNDGAGNLSWSPTSGGFTSFTLVNNQTSPANITGWLVNGAANNAFTTEFSIVRQVQAVSGFTYVEDATFATNVGTGANSNGVFSQSVDSTRNVFVVGDFTSFNGTSINNIVKLSGLGITDSTFTTNIGTGANAVVRAVAVDASDKVLVGGAFTAINGTTVNSLARLNNDGTLDTTFNTNLGTGFNNSILGIAVDPTDDSIVVVGSFNVFNGNVAFGVIKLNNDGTENTTFTTNIGTGVSTPVSSINTVAINSTGGILVGGTFSTFNGNSRLRLEPLNSDGTENSSFYTNLGTAFSSTVLGIAIDLSDDSAVIVGSFANFNGTTRNGIVRVDSTGTEDATFAGNTGTGLQTPVTGFSVAISPTSGDVTIGGNFTVFNGNSRLRLIQLSSAGVENTSFATGLGTGITGGTVGVRHVTLNNFDQVILGGNFTALNGNARGGITEYPSLAFVAADGIVTEGTIRGVYRSVAGTWSLGGEVYIGDAPGVTLSITNAGQVQYTSTDLLDAGFTSQIRFLITRL